MGDAILLQFDNIAGLKEAARLAPKRVQQRIRQEMLREGKVLQTAFRKAYLFGEPGISLPARQASVAKRGKVSFKKRKDKDARKIQLSHVRMKVVPGKFGVVLVGYLSRFLTFHRPKFQAAFFSMFRAIAPRLQKRVEVGVAKVTQAVLDKGLRDANRKRGRR